MSNLFETEAILLSGSAETPSTRGHLQRTENGKPKESLWNIRADGGEPKDLGLNMHRISHLRIHPDGEHIAFHSGRGTEEIWVMENFIPKTESKK